jgi:hypothetical protein
VRACGCCAVDMHLCGMCAGCICRAPRGNIREIFTEKSFFVVADTVGIYEPFHRKVERSCTH